jgi:hypothetical protein
MEFICSCCGNPVSTDESGTDNVQCAECEEQWDASQMVAIQIERIPAADYLRAKNMLDRKIEWIDAQRQSGRLPAVLTSDGIRFPLSAIHYLGVLEGIAVRPLQQGTALWIPARQHRSSGGFTRSAP